jgi:hypothetical protein
MQPGTSQVQRVSEVHDAKSLYVAQAAGVGGGLQAHSWHPFESTWCPNWQAMLHTGGHVFGHGPMVQPQVPSGWGEQVISGVEPPGHATGGGGGHWDGEHAGGGLHLQVVHPFASITLPHWQ